MTNRNENEALNLARQSKSIFQKIRLPLDEGLKRSQSSFSLFNKPFKGLWVSNVSHNDVDVEVRFNSNYDNGSSISLRKNMVINHEMQVIDAVFTAPPQAGKWIEIVFGIDTKIDIGNIEQYVTGEVGLNETTLKKLTQEKIKILDRDYEKEYFKNNNIFVTRRIIPILSGTKEMYLVLNRPNFTTPIGAQLDKLDAKLKYFNDNGISYRTNIKAIKASVIFGHDDFSFSLEKHQAFTKVGPQPQNTISLINNESFNFDNIDHTDIPSCNWTFEPFNDESYMIHYSRSSASTLETQICIEYIMEVEEL